MQQDKKQHVLSRIRQAVFLLGLIEEMAEELTEQQLEAIDELVPNTVELDAAVANTNPNKEKENGSTTQV